MRTPAVDSGIEGHTQQPTLCPCPASSTAASTMRRSAPAGSNGAPGGFSRGYVHVISCGKGLNPLQGPHLARGSPPSPKSGCKKATRRANFSDRRLGAIGMLKSASGNRRRRRRAWFDSRAGIRVLAHCYQSILTCARFIALIAARACCLDLPSFSYRGNGRVFRQPSVPVSCWAQVRDNSGV